jgi:hypothetical protein
MPGARNVAIRWKKQGGGGGGGGGTTAPTITTNSLPGGTVGSAYNGSGFALSASGTAPITWSVTGGESVLTQAGLNFNTSTGVISGTCADDVFGMVTFQASNAYGTDSKTLSLTVSDALPSDLPNVSATITPLQGARNGTPITVNAWSLINSVTNFAGQWAQYVGTISGGDEGIVVYIWTGPSNWRCMQIAGKMGPVLTHFSNGSTFFTDSTKTTPQTGTAPDVLAMTPLKFNLSATESGTAISWICGDHTTKKTALSAVEVHYTVPVFMFNSVPPMTMSRAVDAVKEWRLFGVYTDSDNGPQNSGTPAPATIALPPSGQGFTGGGYSPENPAPTTLNNSTYEDLVLAGMAGDAWSGRSYFETNEAGLLDAAIKNTLPVDMPTYAWRLMSQGLNLARVPLYCVWNDLAHRVNDPQKGTRPIRWMTNGFAGADYGIKDAYAIVGTPNNKLAISHPYTGTSYMYEVTGCPIFAIISSGVLAFQISSEYAWIPKIANNYSGYSPAALDSTSDRSESWGFGRISKLVSELPQTGYVPGAFTRAELEEMLTEMPLVPNVGMVARMAKRKAQTTKGTTVNSTLVYLDQLMNFPMMTVCEYNNNADAPHSESGGAWFSNLMFMYALENSIIHAIAGRTNFINYVGDILTCFERCVYVFGRGNLYRTSNFSVGPQVTEANKGSAYSIATLDDIKTYRQNYGTKGYISDYPAFYAGYTDFDNKMLICQVRMMRFIAVAAQKGKLPAAWQARAQAVRDALLAGCAAVSNPTFTTSYGNYFGVPPAIESQMQSA